MCCSQLDLLLGGLIGLLRLAQHPPCPVRVRIRGYPPLLFWWRRFRRHWAPLITLSSAFHGPFWHLTAANLLINLINVITGGIWVQLPLCAWNLLARVWLLLHSSHPLKSPALSRLSCVCCPLFLSRPPLTIIPRLEFDVVICRRFLPRIPFCSFQHLELSAAASCLWWEGLTATWEGTTVQPTVPGNTEMHGSLGERSPYLTAKHTIYQL